MISAITEALREVLWYIGTTIKAIFESSIIGSNDLGVQYKFGFLGTAIIIMIAVSAAFFAIRGIKKILWGR